ncbi:MAG: glycosyltransferase family 4 protein [Rhodothermales bacterium]|nr:glycosyltransferase family 4 protein [Rhodothermales bacterium]
MKPRILFLDHVGVLGGAELSLLDIAAHFAPEGTAVLFEDGPFRERLEAAGVSVEILPAPPAFQGVRRGGGRGQDVRSLPGVARLALRVARRARRYDVLYASSQKAFVVAALAGRLARRPVLWHLHDLLSDAHFSEGHRRLVIRLANRWAARVVTNSEASARAFVEAGGRADRIAVVYYGIPPAPFLQTPDVAALRRDLGLGAAPVVGLFSRLAPWKGQHVLLGAIEHLPSVHALLVGGALFDEDAYAARLRERAAAPALAGRVHFLGFRDDVAALMHVPDVVVHTSTAPEPFGRVVVEGMLAGRPVVAARAGGVPEILDDERTGLLVDPADADALARALRRLLDDPEEAAAMAAAGRAEALRRFAPARMYEGIEAQLRLVLRGAGR